MSNVTEIIEAVQRLGGDEKEEFLLLLREVDFDGVRDNDDNNDTIIQKP